MGVSDEAKHVIPLKFLRKMKNIFFPLVNSIRGHTVYFFYFDLLESIRFFNVKFLQNDPGVGIDYEVYALAYFALKLNNATGVQNYSIKSNAKNFGKFDDVVINLEKNKENSRFAIQLKHKESSNRNVNVTVLKNSKGDYSVQAYYEEYKKMKDEYKESQFILYTNAPNGLKQTTDRTKKNKIDAIQFTIIEDFDHENDIVKLFDSSSQEGNVYKFEAKSTTSNEGENDTEAPEYERFLSRLRLFVNQKNETDLEQDMIKILGEKTATQYIEFFRKWHKGRFEDKKKDKKKDKQIDKKTVNVHLIESFLSSCIITDRYFPVGQNEKFKLFEKVIKHFDVTVVNDSFKNFIKENLIDDFNLGEGIEEKLKPYKKQYNIEQNASTNDECIMRLAKKFKIIDTNVTKLENEVKLKVLHYVFEKPIIVNFNETSEELIYKLMELHQLGSEIKFILVGQGIQSERLRRRFRILENVNDLRRNEELYTEVTGTCRLSLQGRKGMTLKELIDSCKEICEHIGAKEVLQMLKGTFLIGQVTESIPSFYINRRFSLKVKTIDAFLDDTFLKKHLTVVKFDGIVKKLQNEHPEYKINVVDVHKYLKLTQISNEPTIISTNEEFSEEILQNIKKKSGNKSVIYLRISEDNGFLNISLEENQFPRLIRPVNILCADAGMGKTTMMKKFRNDCDSRFWTIDVELKTHNEFFKTKHDANELLNHLIEGNEKSFSNDIRDIFRSKKKVLFFFDGLDEVEKSYIDNVLDSVEKLSSEGFHVWISSRKNLKTKLEDRFKKVAMDMEEVEEEQQKLYIKNRLKEEYNDEQIENLISKIFNSFAIDNNYQTLGKVLQLYIITQSFLDDKELHQKMTENTFVFIKLYELFFRGRFKHNLDKEESKNSHLSLADREDILEKYEPLAVTSVFGEEILKKLNLDMRRARRFLNQIKTNKDPLGIVTKVNEEEKAVFEHFTYGEYFAAQFFANNFDKARLIREELFSEGHKNLMMILNIILAEKNPLHLAVIFRNVVEIAKHIEDKNIYDKGGRNPLHLATYFEPRCVDRKSCLIEVSKEADEYLTNIDILKKMVKFSYADCDKLFQRNALKYALENKSFVFVEIILKTCEHSKGKINKHIKKDIDTENLVLFCLTHGCRKLLSSVFETSQKSRNYFNLNPYSIIKHTIKNCYFQEDETLRFVIQTFEHKDNFVVDSINERGETALHLAIKYKKKYAVKILLEKGASVNASTKGGLTPLHYAAQSGNLETVKISIEKGASVNAPTEENVTPLHYAAQSGNSELVALLIEKGASVDASTTSHLTVLHYAAQSGNAETAALLIEKGSSVNAATNGGLTSLHYAAQSGNLETVKILIEKEASVNAPTEENVTPLHYAAQSGNSELVALLIEKGASVDASTTSHLTVLHYAAQSGNAETAAFLIEKGSSVNAATNGGLTSLHYAAQSGNLETVELLIEKGLSVNARTKSNVTPLHYAAQSGNTETVELLIEKEASVDASTTSHLTVLHYAAQSVNTKTVELLIEKGLSVNARTKSHVTPLHYAAQSGNTETVELLIEKEASVDASTTSHLTVLHYAAQSVNTKTVELLIEKGLSVNARTNSHVTPLHYAAQSGNTETVELLIEKEASVDASTTDKNETPLHWAAQRGNSKIVELLLQKGASVNALAIDNGTPLHYATQSGNPETIALLMGEGASVK
jgi:ankyrin repeat protein